MRISGSQKITLAIAILILQPPEKLFEGLYKSSYWKPIPKRIYIALASAPPALITSSLAAISAILLLTSETSDLPKSFLSSLLS